MTFGPTPEEEAAEKELRDGRRFKSKKCDYTGTPPFADAEWAGPENDALPNPLRMCEWCAGTGHPYGDESYGICECPALTANIQVVAPPTIACTCPELAKENPLSPSEATDCCASSGWDIRLQCTVCGTRVRRHRKDYPGKLGESPKATLETECATCTPDNVLPEVKTLHFIDYATDEELRADEES